MVHRSIGRGEFNHLLTLSPNENGTVFNLIFLLQFYLMTTTFKNAQVLVTGAGGFIGSHLCEHLLEAEARVVGVDNFMTGRRSNLHQAVGHPRFLLIEADCTQDPRAYLPGGDEFDFIFHLASPASPADFTRLAREIYRVNAFGTSQLLEYAREKSPATIFIFASTSEVYGDPLVHPQVETYWGNVNPNGPRSCYDESKRFGEMVCGVFARDLNLDVRIARIFNTYGPRLRPDEGRVISTFLRQALTNQPFTIHGDGSQTRSYCYVGDMVEGLSRFALKPDLAGETINLGNPAEYTVKDTAELIHRLFSTYPDRPPSFVFKPLPPNDPIRRQPDISKANRLLGWTPQISLADGLRTMGEFYREQEKLEA